MRPENTPQAKLTTIASFPENYFLENIAVRSDNSMLVTVMNQKELWFAPPAPTRAMVEPLLLCRFGQPALGIVEVEPDVFYICTSNIYTSHESYLHRIDLRGWTPGAEVSPEVVLEFPKPVGALNGCCLIAPNVILIADSVASLIWRVDLAADGSKPMARIWLSHANMANDPNGPMPDQPGVNGVRYAAKAGYLYYTSTSQMLFMRVPVDRATHDPGGEPEFVAGGMMGDDFCIDEEAGVAYVTTHRQNTIDRVWLDPAANDGSRHSVAGDPFTEDLIGPSAGAWGRNPGDQGRVAYFLTDGGTKSPPPDGIVRPAKLLRVEFQV